MFGSLFFREKLNVVVVYNAFLSEHNGRLLSSNFECLFYILVLFFPFVQTRRGKQRHGDSRSDGHMHLPSRADKGKLAER